MRFSLAFLIAAFTMVALAEPPYAFRSRLVTVHRTDRRDLSVKPNAGDFILTNGLRIVVAPDAPALVRRAAADFQDYLLVSMGVNASLASEGGAVTVTLDATRAGSYEVDVRTDGIRLRAAGDRLAAQAFYHLEDRLNLRRGPFLACGTETRRPVFAHRVTFSGFGNDLFPDAHLNMIAHYGFTDIEIWTSERDVISQGARQDIRDLCERAAHYGLGTLFQPRNFAFVHPDDPRAEAMYRSAYGAITEHYPMAGGITFYGEVCEFPSKDTRANGRSWRDRSPKDPKDSRPKPGWFPCYDWADWVRKVKPIVRERAPHCRFVFSTYNWGRRDAKLRADLIASLPRDITLIPTFEAEGMITLRNGLTTRVADYSLSNPGPSDYFASEAAQAKELGIELWSNSNSAGLSWDFGNVPYQPCPWQWRKRWEALKDAHRKWNLTGLRENHEYGWCPSFIAEMEKECLTEGGLDFDVFARALASRDFGEENADRVLEVWRLWSRAAADFVPTCDNQYGPCRIGPAYPFNFYGPTLQTEDAKPPRDFPLAPGCQFDICLFEPLQSYDKPRDDEFRRKEIELFESQAADYRAGLEIFRAILPKIPEDRRDEAVRQIALGEYLMRTCLTCVHVKRARLAYLRGDRAGVMEMARREYANAQAALQVVDADSRLGYLVSSDYTGGRRQIEWKLAKMRALYGDELPAKRHPSDF